MGFWGKLGRGLRKGVGAPVRLPAKAVQKATDTLALKVTLGILRHVLTTFGGLAIANGYGTSSDMEQIVGSIVTVVGILWSVVEKRKQHQAEQARLNPPAH